MTSVSWAYIAFPSTLSGPPAQDEDWWGLSRWEGDWKKGGEGGRKKGRRDGGKEGCPVEPEVIALLKRAWVPRFSQFLGPQMLPLYVQEESYNNRIID